MLKIVFALLLGIPAILVLFLITLLTIPFALLAHSVGLGNEFADCWSKVGAKIVEKVKYLLVLTH